ncbi:MAG: FkbM family methyltransferase [Acidobacteriota bacterium]
MRLNHVLLAFDRFGPGSALKLALSHWRLRRILPDWTTALHLRDYPHPFHFRHGTTDGFVITDGLLLEQYSCVRGLQGVRTIVDAGANIGTSSVFFLNAYPEATVIALEPDPGNFEVLRRNLAPYGARAVPLQCALWHRSGPLTVDRGAFRDGGEWSFQVKEAAPGEAADLQGVTLAELLRIHHMDTIDLLKIDIEGAEREVFEAPTAACFDRIGTVAIELHDQACRAAFLRAASAVPGEVSDHGEVTVWRALSAVRKTTEG